MRIVTADGIKAATVRSIAEEAQVTLGLIRYHFKSKDELIIAAYEKHMHGLIEAASVASEGDFDSAKKRLAMFVKASVMPPITDPQAIALWSGFFQMLFHNEAMRASHRKTYNVLRVHIKQLVAGAFEEERRSVTEQELRRLSIACNAILDGLWIEAGALPDEFSNHELVDVAVRTFSATLDLDLMPYIH